MTTSQSPLRVLKAQADSMAAGLKAVERGEKVAIDPLGKLVAARGREKITFGIVMDDKLIKITMPWSKIQECSEVALSAYILKQMKDIRSDLN